jgi:peptide/nickel transport system permease protein
MTPAALMAFAARRAATMAVLLVAMSILIFGLLYLSPGHLEQILLGDKPSTPETLQALRAEYHLDDPLYVQYLRWAGSVSHFDFGVSLRTGEPVLQGILRRLSITAFLGAYGFLLAVASGLFLGVIAAVRKSSGLDRVIVALSVIGASSPAFVTGILLLFLLGIVFPIFPVFGQGEGFLDQLWHMTLPAVALALTGMALLVRVTRSSMIIALDQDHVAFARARGLAENRVRLRYALGNSLNPVLTACGLIFGRMLFGTVLVEVTFSIPGIGSLLIASVNFKDVPMVQGIALLTSIVVIGVNMIIDVLYAAIDPRVRLGEAAL